jgi:uncharacterized membrane protein
MRLRKNLCSGVFSLVFSVLLWILIPLQISGKRMLYTAAVGSDYLPRIVAVCCFAVGLVMLVNSLLLKKEKIIEIHLKAEARVLGAVTVMFIFIVLSPLIGFLVSSILAMVLILVYLKCRKWHYYLSMVLLAGFIYVTFKFLLNVRLP